MRAQIDSILNNKHFRRATRNPNTSLFGAVKIIGGVWFAFAHRSAITPDILMQPNTFPAALAIVSGINDIFFVGDAKDEMKAGDMTPDTTVVVEKSDG